MKKKVFVNKFRVIFISFLLFVIATITGFTIGYSANSISGTESFTSLPQLSFEWTLDTNEEGFANWIFNKENTSITGQVKSESGMCSDTNYSGTLTIKYLENIDDVNLSFDYTVNLNGGSCKIKNNVDNSDSSISSNGSYSCNLNSGGSVSISISSGSTDNFTEVILSNFKCPLNKEIEITLKNVQYGYFLFNGNKITEEEILTIKDTDNITLEAFPDTGYQFVGWIGNGSLISYENPVTTNLYTDTEIYPFFINEGTAVFSNSGKVFSNLNEAVAFAKTSTDKVIVLVGNGGLLAPNNSDYIIDDGITLYIPSSNLVNLYYNEEMMTRNTTTPYEFSRLTIGENTTIKVENNGTIYVSGQAHVQSGGDGTEGGTVGGYGVINLSTTTSKIILNDSSTLYCYGFITGNGLVEAHNGSEIHEIFQINDFRGGSLTLAMLGKCFVFNQYFIQNIESLLRIYKGANLIGHTALYASSMTTTTNFVFLGDSGVFTLENDDSYIERVYNYNTDKIIYDIYGSCSLSSISLSVSGSSISSADYVLPINSNFTVNAKSGSKIIINQNLYLEPGVSINIDEGSEVRFSNKAYMILYDTDTWAGNKFSHTADIETIRWSASFYDKELSTSDDPSKVSGKPTVRIKSTNMPADYPDAEINLNGTLIVNDGAGLYATYVKDNETGQYISGGAKIYSSNGSGTLIYYEGFGQMSSTLLFKGGENKGTSIPIDLPLLENGENSDVEFLDLKNMDSSEFCDKNIYYNSDTNCWEIEGGEQISYLLNYYDPKSGKTYQSAYTPNEEFKILTETEVGFEYNNYSIKYWLINNTTLYKPNEIVKIDDLGDVTAVAVWGGWIDVNSKFSYVDYNSGEYLTGLNRVENMDGTGTGVYLFDNHGIFSFDYTGSYTSNGSTYAIENGTLIEEEGFHKILTGIMTSPIYNYVFVTSDNEILKDGTYTVYCEDADKLLPSGAYQFDENGYVVKEDSSVLDSDGKMYINNGKTYIDGIRVAFGLFEQENYLYYSDSNGNIVKDKTFYVSDNNGYNITEGLYYFNSEGKMCDEKLNVIEVSSLA